MIPRNMLVQALLVLCWSTTLAPISLVLGAPSPDANPAPVAHPNTNQNLKRSPPINFPIRRRQSAGQVNANGKRVFTIEQIAEIRRKDLERLKLLQRRDKLNHDRKRSGWETVALTSYSGDAFYYASIEMGTPPQRMDVSLDTGSSDLWVQSSTCTTCSTGLLEPAIDGSKASFNYQSSTSFHASSPQDNVSLQYADGSGIQGVVATDTVTVGQYTSPNQTFILALAQSSNFYSAGLMGLGWQSLAQSGGTPYWLSVIDQFESPEFSFFLAEWNESGSANVAEGGQFTLGGRNSSLFDGEVTFIPLLQQSYWTIPFESIIVSSNATLALTGVYASAIVDSGTTLIYGPDDVVAAFYAAIPGSRQGSTVDISLQGQYLVPCTTTVTPKFQFNRNATFTIPTTNLLWGQLSGSSNLCVASLMGTGSVASLANAATASSVPNDTPRTPNWILGDAFMKSVYTVFRKGAAGEQPSVGFAPIKGFNYASNGFAIIGESGNGVDGRIGQAGATVIGTGSPTNAGSQAITSVGANGVTTVVNGQVSVTQTPTRNAGTTTIGLANYLVALVFLGAGLAVNW